MITHKLRIQGYANDERLALNKDILQIRPNMTGNLSRGVDQILLHFIIGFLGRSILALVVWPCVLEAQATMILELIYQRAIPMLESDLILSNKSRYALVKMRLTFPELT
jgi:hypothetical protein